MERANLYDETMYALEWHGKVIRQIKYITNAEGIIPVAKFFEKAKDTFYDNVNSVQIDPTLKIVGKTWWLSREIQVDWNEKTGVSIKEGWYFHERPEEPTIGSSELNLYNLRSYFKPVYDPIIPYHRYLIHKEIEQKEAKNG